MQQIQELIISPQMEGWRVPQCVDTLFFRGGGAQHWHWNEEDGCGRLEAGETLDLEAYFNVFAWSRWRHDCDLQDLDLCLEFSGELEIGVWARDAAGEEHRVVRDSFTHSERDTACLHLFAAGDEPDASIVYLFVRLQAGSRGTVIHGGSWCSGASPRRQCVLGVIIPTYKREALINETIRRLSPYIEREQRVHVIIVDNGCSLPALELPERMRVVKNLNYGGSGGFARGLLELESTPCTHFLFSDDDAVLIPSVLERILTLLEFATDEKLLIKGAMLDLDQPARCLSNGTFLEFHEGHLCKNDLDLGSVEGLVEFFRPQQDNVYGWWCAVLPRCGIEEVGYPLPFFKLWDDCEFSLRLRAAGYRAVELNGVQVWHLDHDAKPYTSPVDTYYYWRNQLILEFVHFPVTPWARIRKILAHLRTHLYRWEYDRAVLLLKGIADACRGPEYLAGLRPDEQLSQLRETYHRPLQTIPVPGNSDDHLQSAAAPSPAADENSLPARILRKLQSWLVVVTGNGALLPRGVFRLLAGGWGRNRIPRENWCDMRDRTAWPQLGADRAFFIIPDSTQGIETRPQALAFLLICFRVLVQIPKWLWQFSRAERIWRSRYATLTQRSFWQRYLKREN